MFVCPIEVGICDLVGIEKWLLNQPRPNPIGSRKKESASISPSVKLLRVSAGQVILTRSYSHYKTNVINSTNDSIEVWNPNSNKIIVLEDQCHFMLKFVYVL